MKLRIATFNLENLDDVPGEKPTLQERIEVLRPLLQRMDADVLCLQEVHSQLMPDQTRQLSALLKLLADTRYADYSQFASSDATTNALMDERNLVILSRFPLVETRQFLHELIPAPKYQMMTAIPPAQTAEPVQWDRPMLYAKIQICPGEVIHLINLHLKSRFGTLIPGQLKFTSTWRSVAGWAEGSFLSDMKRMGQALEARVWIDQLLDQDPQAKIIVCGDFNAVPDELPVETILGRVENTGNAYLNRRAMIACEASIPESSRYSYIYHGQKKLLDHALISQSCLPNYRRAEIFNETLHDESVAQATDQKFLESDHAPFIAEFEFLACDTP